MRILSVTASYFPFLEFGGPPVKVKALAEGLASRGHQVTVLTADWGLAERLAANELRGKIQKSPYGWEYEEHRVRCVYLPTRLRYRALSWNPAVSSFCRSELTSFDVVHIFGLYDLVGVAVGNRCRAAGKPYVVEPIGMFRPIVRSFRAKRLYHTLWGRNLLSGAARLIATSKQEAEELRDGGFAAEQIVLRRNGVEIPASLPARGIFRSKFGISESAKVVLFLGRLSRKKSPELLLRSFAQLSGKEFADNKLVFAGPDSEHLQPSLEREAARLGISGRVLFAGPVYGDEKWSAYRDADVFVLPSQNENFGNSAAEAIACGIPTVVTENCGIAPLMEGAGMVVKHEAESIASALKQVLKAPEIQRRLTAAGAQFAMKLGWQEPVQQMESLYAALAARGMASAQ